MLPFETSTFLTRVVWDQSTYQFKILANARRNNEPRSRSELVFLETHCLAIVEYCFPGWQVLMPEGNRLHVPSYQYEKIQDICLKTLRCGGVFVDNTEDDWTSVEDHYVEVLHEQVPKYYFGWPNDGDGVEGERSKDAVWVLTCHPRPADMDHVRDWWQAMDDLSAVLERCNTMQEYCKVLEERGAKYYSHVEDSPEARQHDVPIVAWPTSDTWRTKDAMKSEQNLKPDIVETGRRTSDFQDDRNTPKRISGIFGKLFNK
ncbi:unnamed protein product [Cercospora beticola]|nr:unnamed protein product [Cercospora beticola]